MHAQLQAGPGAHTLVRVRVKGTLGGSSMSSDVCSGKKSDTMVVVVVVTEWYRSSGRAGNARVVGQQLW
jgi:hypothetical protein